MRNLVLLVFSMLAALPATAHAEKLSVDLQLLVPTPSSTGFLSADSAQTPKHLAVNFGAMATYGHNMLQVVSVQPGGTKVAIGPVVDNRIDLNLYGSIGLFNWAEIGLVFPLVYSGGFDKEDFRSNDIDVGTDRVQPLTQGNLRLIPKLRFLNVGDGAFAMAVMPTLILPTGGTSSLAGEAIGAFAPSLLLSSNFGPFQAALNLGYKLRRSIVLGGSNIAIGSEIFAKIAVSYTIVPAIEVVGEVFGLTQATHPFGFHTESINKRFGSPVEGDVAVKVHWRNYTFVAGGGGGLSPGYGAPAPRIFLGASFDTSKTVLPDRDHDGIPDIYDKCPDKPEDHDGFEDEDGCPDPDNDRDHILDDDDQCPNEPEDKDNFQDDDGCPDLDNDHDGILDSLDSCPNDPEDRDGFEDEDGCPDPDNDRDGIVDGLDGCPDAPEDKDNFEDADGCPDLDNDQDGLPDLNDQCPNFPEDMDGVRDDDGCPEDNDRDGIPDDLDKCPNEPETYNGFEDEDGCPDVAKVQSLVQITDDKIAIKQTIYFKAGKAIIEPRSYVVLEQVASVMRNFQRVTKLRVEGHTDNTGNRKKNITLSQQRADSVRRYLIEQGISASRLESVGYGPDHPIASNKTANGRDKNRRVEFVIANQEQVGQEAKPQVVPDHAVLQAPPGVPVKAPLKADPGDLLDLSIPTPKAAESKSKPTNKSRHKAASPAPSKKGNAKKAKHSGAKKKSKKGEKDIEFHF